MASAHYIGRFAPSPTGRLHFGSLLAAVGSYLQARTAGGLWRVRMEDLDRPRCKPGADRDILATLEAFGLEWDGSVEYQSRRLHLYDEALDRLSREHRIYACSCSRTDIAALNQQRSQEFDSHYPGTCRRKGLRLDSPDVALRFAIAEPKVEFQDTMQGPQSVDVAATTGDFVLRRRDGLHAYHLAVVVDDAAQGVTEVVRGADLLASTPLHLVLQQALGYDSPHYAHLPLAVDAGGAKLSKSSQSVAIEPKDARFVLWQAFEFLRQRPPLELRGAALADQWRWAVSAWSIEPLRGIVRCIAPAADAPGAA